MSNRAWMPLSIDDYMADTGHLTATEHGAYMLLIMRYWKDGGLPDDERLIQRYARLDSNQWQESRDVIAAFFEPGWRHKRIDAELAKADEIIGKRKAAAEARYASRSKADAHAVQVQSTSSDTRVPPLTTDLEKEEPNGSSKKRGSRLPTDWEPDVEFAVSLGLSRADIDLEAQKFREWWPAQPGQKGVKLDWNLTWMTWCRKALADRSRFARGSPPPSRPRTTQDAAADLLRRMQSANHEPDQGNSADQPLALGFSGNG